VHLAEDAKQQLVKTGYDPRLGARPMRRVIQRTVEDLVAKRMLSGQVTPGSVIDVSLADVQTVLQK
jgi:ATP-dependent Clp protease ATP-binding subunit ClpA